jgi:hypothetical protein
MPASCNCTSSTLPSSNSIQAVGCLDSINSSKDILGIKIKANHIEPRAIEIEKEKKEKRKKKGRIRTRRKEQRHGKMGREQWCP